MTRKVHLERDALSDKAPLNRRKSLIVLLSLVVLGFIGYLIVSSDKEEPRRELPIQPITVPKEPVKAGTSEQSQTPPVVEAPKAETATAPEQKAKVREIYTVKKGDTLSRIAGSKWKAVCELNRLENCNRLHPGQELRLPEGGTRLKAKPAPVAKKPVAAKVKPKAVIHPAEQSLGEFVWRVVGGAPLKNCGRKDAAMINEEAWVALGLTTEEREELRALLVLSGHAHEPRITGDNRVQLVPGMRFPAVSFCEKGKAVARTSVRTAWDASQGVFGERFVLSTGKRLIWVRNCHNWVLDHPAPVEPEPSVPPPAPVPTSIPEEPLQPLSAIPAKGEEEWRLKAKLKYELIAGAWYGDANATRFHGHYAEGLLLAEFQNGYEVGIGAYGMRGHGGGKADGSYRWSEGNGWGPQVALKRNYLMEQQDEFGQTLLLPAGWEVKARFVNDKVTGNNPVSGYAQQQTGKKFGLYADYYEQRDYDWIYGVTAEAWWSYDRRIRSTFVGDRPQDRGSFEVAGYAQYRHSEKWQSRWIASLSHQNWDRLNYLNLAVELRWQETVMCGPRFAFALNKGVYPDSVPRHDLDARLFYCRIELGNELRAFWKEENQKSVRYMGPASAQASTAPAE